MGCKLLQRLNFGAQVRSENTKPPRPAFPETSDRVSAKPNTIPGRSLSGTFPSNCRGKAPDRLRSQGRVALKARFQRDAVRGNGCGVLGFNRTAVSGASLGRTPPEGHSPDRPFFVLSNKKGGGLGEHAPPIGCGSCRRHASSMTARRTAHGLRTVIGIDGDVVVGEVAGPHRG